MSLRAGVTFCRHLDIIRRKQACDSVDLPLPPVCIVLVDDIDELSFVEVQFVLVIGDIIIHRYNLTHWNECWSRLVVTWS